MSANLKNFGVRLSNVARPIYNADTMPIIFANEALGGLHITRSLAEFEKITQRLMIGMEVVSLDESTCRDNDGNIVSASKGGKPEVGRWRLVDATISCSGASSKCPLFTLYGNKKCLFEYPKCCISSITNCKWKRLYDDEHTKMIPDWKELINVPEIIKYIENQDTEPIPYFNIEQINFYNSLYSDKIPLIASDGKIDIRLLRESEGKGTETVYWNERILIDHSFFEKDEWVKYLLPVVSSTLKQLSLGEKVQQVNCSLLYSLEEFNFESDKSQLNSFTLNNTKIKSLDLRKANKTLEKVNVNNNPLLEEIWISDVDLYTEDPFYRIPLKEISFLGCPSLKKIHISGSQVRTLNLQGCRNLIRLFADNTQLSSLICQESYSLSSEDDYPIFSECIHYFIRNNCMNEIAYESAYNTLYNAYNNFVVCIHTGDTSYARNSKTEIATSKGHIICFCEGQPF